jgi:hypothetical protein
MLEKYTLYLFIFVDVEVCYRRRIKSFYVRQHTWQISRRLLVINSELLNCHKFKFFLRC